ncbi:hypothetical protein, partial [Escherichia coli]|uniref:hypothetical protein n=1 Tax=Escherichia coli TaxID=562 RepID=UPI0019537462
HPRSSIALAMGSGTGAGLTLPRLVQVAIDRYLIDETLPIEQRLAGVAELASIFLLFVVTLE